MSTVSLLLTLNPDHNLILVGRRSTAIILLGGFQVAALQVYLSLSAWCGVTSDGGDAGGNGYWAHGLQQMFEWLATFRDWLSGGHRTPYIKHIRSYSSTKPATNRTRKLFVLRRCSFNTLLPLPKALSLCCCSCSKSRIGQQLYFYTHPLNPSHSYRINWLGESIGY